MIHRFHRYALASFLVFATTCFADFTAAQQIETYFSPRGGAAVAIITELSKATTSVDVAAFQLTHPKLAEAILDAHQRGLAVRVIVDRSQESKSATQPGRLRGRGCPIRTDAFEKLQHNKYAVIDGRTTITGSYNWSENAENRNAENLIIISDVTTAKAFADDFEHHWSHSRPYIPGDVPGPKPFSPRAFSNPLHPGPRN